jgi:hypothetical protein
MCWTKSLFHLLNLRFHGNGRLYSTLSSYVLCSYSVPGPHGPAKIGPQLWSGRSHLSASINVVYKPTDNLSNNLFQQKKFDLETSSEAFYEYFLPTYVNFHVKMATKHGVGEALGRALSQGLWALQAASPQL